MNDGVNKSGGLQGHGRGVVSQVDAEAGISTLVKNWTAERVGQAIAALAPSGGGGSALVGELKAYIATTAPTGWIILSGASAIRSLGNAASGAGYAAADALDLFAQYWDSMADAQAPVSSGRGTDAASDFAANKTITLPDYRGRAIIGMGTGSGLTARINGETGGAETHQLTVAELASHYHTATRYDGLFTLVTGATYYNMNSSSAISGSTGSSTVHANMQPWVALNLIQKL